MSSTGARAITVRHRKRGIPTAPTTVDPSDWVGRSLSALVDHPALIEDMPLRIRQIRSIYGKAYSTEWIARSMHRWITTGASMDAIARELKVSIATVYRYRNLMSEWLRGRMGQYVAEDVVLRELFDYETMEQRMWTDARDVNIDRDARRLAMTELRHIKHEKNQMMERVRLYDNVNLERMAEDAVTGGTAVKRPAEAIQELLKIGASVIEGECVAVTDD